MTPNPELQAMLRALEVEFAAKVPGRLREMQAVLQRCSNAQADPVELATLHRLLHSLAGSAGSFGMGALGTEVRAIEHHVARCEAEKTWGPPDWQQVGAALQAMLDRAEQ